MAATITSLEVQQGNQERVNLYLDGQFAFVLTALEAARLKKGQVLSDEEISALRQQDAFHKALESAIHFLAARPRSSAEVRRRLKEKGIAPSVIEAVIERLLALNYLNDVEFAHYWVRNRQEFKPRGTRALRAELIQKGLTQEIIEVALADLDTDSAALEVAQKKLRSLRSRDAHSARQSLTQHLLRRGFDYEETRQVVNQLMGSFEAENETEGFDDEE